jgi:DNA-binding response OmpR family regulator
MTDRPQRERVLVVEDEAMVALGLEMVLTDAGCDVVGPIGKVDEALATVRDAEVDFALLDVNLHGDEVFPVADALVERGIPFAFLTGYGRDSLPPHHAGGRILFKPFDVSRLVALVKEEAKAR